MTIDYIIIMITVLLSTLISPSEDGEYLIDGQFLQIVNR